MKDGKNKIQWITRTAILIAITITMQALTMQLGNQYVTGTIVNTMLILSVMTCGLPTGLTVGAVTPILPTLMGFGPQWPVVPFIMLGNLALTALWHIIGNIKIKKEQTGPSVLWENVFYVCALVSGASAKFSILYIGIVRVAAPLIMGLPAGHPITIMFSFPQLITASAGGVFAIILLPPLKRALGRWRQ